MILAIAGNKCDMPE